MRWIQQLFKSHHYTSEIDQFLKQLRKTEISSTPGKLIKQAYYQKLVAKRGE